MRYLHLICCLLAATALDAQSNNSTKNSWEISSSFAPEFNKRVQLTGLRIETDLIDIPLMRPAGGYDTINIAGQDRFFGPGNSFVFSSKPTDSNFWFGATVSAHRRIGRSFDFSAGLSFNQSGYATGIDNEVTQRSVVNTSAAIIFALEEVKQRTYGITLRGNYHLFSERRFHPYFGIGINTYILNRDRHLVGRVYLDELAVILPQSPLLPDVSTSQFNLDFVATAGLLYRINDAWSAGLDFTSTPVTGPGLVGIQVRKKI